MGKSIDGVLASLTLLYPPAVYFGLQLLEPWQIAGAFALLLSLRLLLATPDSANRWLLIMAPLLLCACITLSNSPLMLRFYPALVNLGLLMLFAHSLYTPTPLIERLARIQHPDLPEQGVRYTRSVTKVWCFFFLLNGLLALATALWADWSLWSLYNGLIAYVLMGVLMAVEFYVRIRTQAHVR